jgi:hypothetical protein
MNKSEKLGDLLMQLECLLRESGDKNWIRGVVAVRDCLLSEKGGFDAAARTFRSMNSGMGSFSDFYFHHDDFETRARVNRPLDALRDEISKLVY